MLKEGHIPVCEQEGASARLPCLSTTLLDYGGSKDSQLFSVFSVHTLIVQLYIYTSMYGYKDD